MKSTKEFTIVAAILAVDVFIEMGVDVIGCVLGPIAYKIEELVRTSVTEKLILNFRQSINYYESGNWFEDNQKKRFRT